MAKFLVTLPAIIAALVILVVGLFLASLAGRGIGRFLERRKADKQASFLIGRLTYWTIVILTIFTALQAVGFNVTAFLAGLGIAGLTIGFALQDVSKNFVAGLLLMIDRPFNVGDQIEVLGYTGTVDLIDVRATRMKASDGRVVLIPNGDIFINPIVNFTQSKRRRVEVMVGVAPESDLGLARQAALQAVGSIAGLLADPAPQAVFQNYGAASVDLMVYFWIDVAKIDVTSAKDAGIEAVKVAFAQAGVKTPQPVPTVAKL